jgi:hypothetical protein
VREHPLIDAVGEVADHRLGWPEPAEQILGRQRNRLVRSITGWPAASIFAIAAA